MGKPLVGFIGQGFIGKNYADDFEMRGLQVIRYSLEKPYIDNKNKISECDIVFIAVPTPTTPEGFDDSVVRKALALVGKGKIAVIKSTILPGYTTKIQEAYPDRLVLYSPEFLSEKTAAHDAAHPFSNIIGMSVEDDAHQAAAEAVQAVLPEAPFNRVCTSTDAELIKYAHNGSGYVQIVFFNLMYDLATRMGANWDAIAQAVKADPMISNRYSNPVHMSGHPGAQVGRGAGGHCFIKDFAALRDLYERNVSDPTGIAALAAFEEENIHLLKNSGKDIDLLQGVYGDRIRTSISDPHEIQTAGR